MISSIIQNLTLIGLIIFLVILLWPQTLTLHFDNRVLFVKYSLFIASWKGERKTGFLVTRLLEFVYRIIPAELLSSLVQTPSNFIDVFTTRWKDLTNKDDDEETPKESKSQKLKVEKQVERNENKQAQEQVEKPVVSNGEVKREEVALPVKPHKKSTTKIVLSSRKSPKASTRIEPKQEVRKDSRVSPIKHEVGKNETILEFIERILGYWKQEKAYLSKMFHWLKRALVISVKLIIPTRVWLRIQGGVEDPKETSDLWVKAFNISGFLKGFIPIAEFEFSPQFTFEKDWQISGELIFRFNFLRFFVAFVLVAITFPFIATSRFYLRWRPKKTKS